MAPKQIKQTTNYEVLKHLMRQTEEIYGDVTLKQSSHITRKVILDNLVYLTAKRGFDGFQDEGK